MTTPPTAAFATLAAALEGRYMLERELGAGGMATVYLARDTRHERRVAIKVLRPELAAIVGGDRFLHEIRTTANLQHPHILALHDSGETNGLVYYVMPYIDGESLRDRLLREKQLPVDDAVRIAREVASGLDYAHRQGVVHRDIKPENILLHDGQAIIADFGIALAVSRSDGSTRITETGMSLGTPQYMSPEQAMGEREITPRSDVYALGCVLYEMLVGEPPFTGPTPQAIVARIVTEEPRSITAQRRTVPPHVEQAVRTAVAKLPADRFATAAQFAEALATPAAAHTGRTVPPAVVHAVPGRRRALQAALLLTSAVVLVAAGIGIERWNRTRTQAPVLPARLSITLPHDRRVVPVPVGTIALSPDGATIVYVGQSERGFQMYRRALDDMTVVPIEGARDGSGPSFSTDGSWLAYLEFAGSVRKIPFGGGASSTTSAASGAGSIVWKDASEFYFSTTSGALALSRSDGSIEVVHAPDNTGETAILPADILPDGRVLIVALTQGVTGPVYVFDPRTKERVPVTRSLAASAAYHDGYIAWIQPNGALVGAKWSGGASDIGGEAHVIASNVRIAPGSPPQVAFSRTGSLVYVPAQPQELMLVDRTGRAEVISTRPLRFHGPRVSPDDSRILVDVTDETRDVWMLNRRDNTFTRVTFDNDGHDAYWMPDGRSFLYSTLRSQSVGVHRHRADGSGTPDSIAHDSPQLTAYAVTPDGKTAIGARLRDTGFDLVLIDIATGKVTPYASSRFSTSHPALSPDGAWLAYVSDEGGLPNVYVRSLASAEGRVMVSQNGGTDPVWSRDGRELYYSDAANIVAATIRTTPELSVVSRVPLFAADEYETASPHSNFDVTRDGKFVFVRQPRASELVYVQNWPEIVRRRAGGR